MFSAKNYVKAESFQQAYELNQKKSNKIIGGMLWLKMNNRSYDTLIDLSALPLSRIEESQYMFRIGAMVTLRELETNEAFNIYSNNAASEALKSIVGVQFRNLATVGGSIFGRYGFSDVLTLFLGMDSYVELYKGGIIPLADFVNMKPDRDILISIIINKTQSKYNYQSVRIAKTDFPVLTCCANRTGNKIKLCFGARPHKAVAKEYDFDLGVQEIAQRAVADIETGSNMRGSKEYRTKLVSVLAKRAIAALEDEK